MPEAEAMLGGKEIGAVQASLAAAGALAGRAADAVTDFHGSAEYKEYIVGVQLQRAFADAYRQALAEEDH
jgi:CO/xanthine dehydrogenase FAD-binding subunit